MDTDDVEQEEEEEEEEERGTSLGLLLALLQII